MSSVGVGVAVGMSPRAVSQWTPASMSGLALWLRADRGVSRDVVTGKVTAWASIDPATYDVAQSTEAQQPSWTASDSDFNGRPVVLPDGNDWLDGAASFGLAQPCWYVAVLKVGAGADYRTVWDAASGTRQIGRYNPSGQTSTFAGLANIDSTTAPTGAHVYIVQYNGATTTHRISSSTVAVTGNAGANSQGVLRLFAAPAGVYPLPAGSKVAEVIAGTGVLGSGDVDDVALLLAYANARYGIAIT